MEKRKKQAQKQEKRQGKGREQEKEEGKGKGTENKLENVCFCDFRAGKLSQFGAGREQEEILVPRGESG